MQQEQSQTGGTNAPSPLNPLLNIGLTAAKTNGEEFLRVQTAQIEELYQLNHYWFERIQSETRLTSALIAKLIAARSVTSAAEAYEDWARQHMALAEEDAKRIIAGGQTLADMGARFLSNGWRTMAAVKKRMLDSPARAKPSVLLL